jgi:hypothetical protein
VEITDRRPRVLRPRGAVYKLSAEASLALQELKTPASVHELTEIASQTLNELDSLGLLLRDGDFSLALPVFYREKEEVLPQPPRPPMDSCFAPVSTEPCFIG